MSARIRNKRCLLRTGNWIDRYELHFLRRAARMVVAIAPQNSNTHLIKISLNKKRFASVTLFTQAFDCDFARK